MQQSVLGRQGIPLFTTFFLWSVGTGAIQLARPLFAASFGVPVFLVSLITSSNSVARLVSAPITGWAMDRWGRKPLLIIGVVLRGATALWEYFINDYLGFLILEFVGGIGVSIWATGSSILIADVSDKKNRGMVVATRSFSIKLGTIGGPAIGAVLVLMFGIRSIFIFNFLTKVIMYVILIYLIRETRPDVPKATASAPSPTKTRIDLKMFLNRPFMTVMFATIAIGTMQQGVFQALFPVFAQDFVGMAAADIGFMMTLAGVTSMLISFPTGWLLDTRGRKASLVPGLLILGASAYLLGTADQYWGVAIMVLVYGVGEGMSMASSQTYAMDLAPDDRRGAFIGVWSFLQNIGAIVTPFTIGVMADNVGFGPTFTTVAVIMGISGLVMAAFGTEPHARARPTTAGSGTAS